MDFSLSEEQRLLKDSVERFVGDVYSLDHRRALVASDLGFSRDHWRQFAELGWLAMPFAEADGGLGGGPLDTMVLAEAFGRGLVVEPYLATVILGGGLIAALGNDRQRAGLAAVMAGETLLALAHVEREARYNLAHVGCRAEVADGGWLISGHKSVVLHGAEADRLLVSARTGGAVRDRQGISLFHVAGDAAGLTIRGYRTIDGLRAADITLDQVSVGADDLLGEAGGAYDAIEATADRATAALLAESLGVMDVLREMTLEYSKTRKQFGRPIGAFQAVQHRLVDMMIACEEMRSLVYLATLSLDGPAGARAVSAAKAKLGQAGRLVGQEAVQLHGGMGMTEELAVGHYFKRLTMIGTLFGDRDHHLDRFAAIGAA